MLKIGNKIPGIASLFRNIFVYNHPKLRKNIFGIDFPNPVGLAAGLDKDAEVYEMLGNLGFGFIEIGTLTPKAQAGNDKPRLFRLKKDASLLNRMGFNNQGIENAIKQLKKRKSNIIIGGNIGKNKLTPNDLAIHDYEICFKSLFNYVDYFVINLSSPNTPGLRELQEKEPLKKILDRLMTLNNRHKNPKAILLKIAPDLTDSQLDDIIEIVSETKIHGVVATNTTISRENLSYDAKYIENLGNGGISGRVLKQRATQIIKYINEKSNESIPIIGVGGISSAEDALEKLHAGASLIQIYTGFIYEGPKLIKDINKAIIKDDALKKQKL